MRKGVGKNVNYTDARPIRIRFDLNFEGFRAKLQSTSISTFKNNGLVDLSCHEEGIGSQGFRGDPSSLRLTGSPCSHLQ